MRLTAVKATTRAALDTVELQPHAFADTWKDKPAKALKVGLRIVSEGDANFASAHAVKVAWQLHPRQADLEQRVDAHNNALMAFVVGRGTCQPLDVAAGFFACAEQNVPLALSSDGIKFLYQALDVFHVRLGIAFPRATDSDLTRLALRLLPLEAIVAAVLLAAPTVAEDTPLRARLIASTLLANPDLLVSAVQPLHARPAQEGRIRRLLLAALDDLDPNRDAS